MSATYPRHAWIDESIHILDSTSRTAIYVLAAVVADSTEAEIARERVRSLLGRGMTRLHWRDLGTASRRRTALAVRELGLDTLVTVGVNGSGRQQERARRKCMERLLFELDQERVRQVWIESRSEPLNESDRVMIAALRGARVIADDLRADFALPSTEPMLWIADAVAGATGMAWKGTETALRRTMGSAVRELVVLVGPGRT